MTKSDRILWPAGLAWRNHFRRSLFEELSAPIRDPWSSGEREILGPSLAQFQLGEASDGRHLLDYTRAFAAEIEDSWLNEAMALFIQEENRHSHWLGEFLKAQGYPLLRSCWIDGVFRLLRKLIGFGLMVSVLASAEIIAVPYYTAVRRITKSEWLQAICTRILRDEAMHLRFQASNLGAVWRRQGAFRALRNWHKALLAVTCFAVWREHGAVLSRGGYTRLSFVARCFDLLDEMHAGALAAQRDAWTARIDVAAPPIVQ